MINCRVIRDLLPLYDNNALSEESNNAVEEHLDNCKDCREYHKQIHRVPHSLQNEESRGGYHYSEIVRNMKRDTIITYVIGTVLLLISTICILKAIANFLKKN